MPTKEELNKGFTIGEWEVLPARGEIRRGEHVDSPERMVMGVLLALAQKDGDVVTKDELIDEIWGGRATSDDAITQKITQLRRHFADKKPYRYVDNMPRIGYRLLQPVVLKEPDQDDVVVPPRPAWRRYLPWVVAAVLAVIAAREVWERVSDVPAVVGSIGIPPCQNLSRDPADEYLVLGFRDELVNTLQNVPGLVVKRGQVNYDDMEIQEIAATLEVETVLLCGVQRDADVLKVNYTVARGSDGINISSGSVTGPLDGIFDLQGQLAVAVRDELAGESSQQLASSSAPASFDAFEKFMLGRYAFEHRGQPGNLEESIVRFKETIASDPDFGPAYLSLAMAYTLLPVSRGAPVEETHNMAVHVVEQGIAVDESIRDAASAIFGYVYMEKQYWAAAEQAFERATSARVVDSTAFNWHALMLARVGRLHDAVAMALKAQQIDPSSALINGRLAIAYTWVDDRENATEYFARAEKLNYTSASYTLSRSLLLRRQGRMDEAQSMVREAVELGGGNTDWIDPVFAGVNDPEKSADALRAIDAAVSGQEIALRVEIVLRTILGDTDRAIDVAMRLAAPEETTSTDFLFLPELKPLREHPKFDELLDRLHVREYWDTKGCIWDNDAVQCPVAM